MKRKLVLIIFFFSFFLTSCSNYYYYKANKAFEKNEFNKALSELNKINKKNIDDKSLLLEGHIYSKLGKKDKAYSCYYLAANLNSSLVIEELIPYYFSIKNYAKILEEINFFEQNNYNISLELRKLQYLSFYKLDNFEMANKIKQQFLLNLSNYDDLEIEILSTSNKVNIVRKLNKLYKNNEIKHTMYFIRLCNDSNLLDNNFLTLLDNIFNNSDFPLDFRIECCNFLSNIFEKMGNLKQAKMYDEYSNQLSSI